MGKLAYVRPQDSFRRSFPLEEVYACITLNFFVIFSITTNQKQLFRLIFIPLTYNFRKSGCAGKKRLTFSYSPGKKLSDWWTFLLVISKSFKNAGQCIISMSGTVSHEVAQHLNGIIQPYLNTKYIVRSSDEFLVHFKKLKLSDNQSLVSLDVASCFTNVPVIETIGLIVAAAYGHQTIPPPSILPEDLRTLLKICTLEIPFIFENC